MKLYRLKDKQTGKYLSACCLYRKPQWTATGVFFRKIDTVRKHAEAICREWEWTEKRKHPHGIRWKIREKSHHPSRMKNLIVVVNDVTLNGEEEIAAAKIFKSAPKSQGE
jgi:hypothetical protein